MGINVDDEQQSPLFIYSAFNNKTKLLCESQGMLMLKFAFEFLVMETFELADVPFIDRRFDNGHNLKESFYNGCIVLAGLFLLGIESFQFFALEFKSQGVLRFRGWYSVIHPIAEFNVIILHIFSDGNSENSQFCTVSHPHPPGKQIIHQPALDLPQLGERGFLGADAGVGGVEDGSDIRLHF